MGWLWVFMVYIKTTGLLSSINSTNISSFVMLYTYRLIHLWFPSGIQYLSVLCVSVAQCYRTYQLYLPSI